MRNFENIIYEKNCKQIKLIYFDPFNETWTVKIFIQSENRRN